MVGDVCFTSKTRWSENKLEWAKLCFDGGYCCNSVKWNFLWHINRLKVDTQFHSFYFLTSFLSPSLFFHLLFFFSSFFSDYVYVSLHLSSLPFFFFFCSFSLFVLIVLFILFCFSFSLSLSLLSLLKNLFCPLCYGICLSMLILHFPSCFLTEADFDTCYSKMIKQSQSKYGASYLSITLWLQVKTIW